MNLEKDDSSTRRLLLGKYSASSINNYNSLSAITSINDEDIIPVFEQENKPLIGNKPSEQNLSEELNPSPKDK